MSLRIGICTAIGISAVGGTLAFLWVIPSPVRRIIEIPKKNDGTA